VALLAWLAAIGPCRAEGYPNRSIHLIVPTGPGGITDLLARLVGERLSKAAGQPVIVENRIGAGGVTGSHYVAQAAPDGYTLLFAFPSHTVNAALYTKLPYDALGSFAPVTMISTFPSVLEVRPNFPARTVQELIALAKSKTDPLTYASVGNGSLAFLSAALFAVEADINLVQAPYESVPEAAMALQSGDVDMFFDTPVTAIPLIKAGKVRALAVTSETRQPSMPDVPSVSETVPGYKALGWNGVLAPKGTPEAVIERLNQLIVGLLRTPEMQAELTGMGVEVVGNTPNQFRAAIGTDITKWSAVIKEAGIQPD